MIHVTYPLQQNAWLPSRIFFRAALQRHSTAKVCKSGHTTKALLALLCRTTDWFLAAVYGISRRVLTSLTTSLKLTGKLRMWVTDSPQYLRIYSSIECLNKNARFKVRAVVVLLSWRHWSFNICHLSFLRLVVMERYTKEQRVIIVKNLLQNLLQN